MVMLFIHINNSRESSLEVLRFVGDEDAGAKGRCNSLLHPFRKNLNKSQNIIEL